VGDWESTLRDGVSEKRTHSPAHEILSVTRSSTPTLTLNHDAKGNMILTSAGQTLAWDVENRLASASAVPGWPGGSYQYDALGRRLSKTTGGLTTRFIHDGDQVVAEYENGTLKRRYVYGTYIDEPLARLASTGTLYYHQNRIYSAMALTNQSGQLAERYGYTPYGKRRVMSSAGATLTGSAVGNQIGFTGRYHDVETQLIYFRARYQDAELGRFLSRIRWGQLTTLPRQNLLYPQRVSGNRVDCFTCLNISTPRTPLQSIRIPPANVFPASFWRSEPSC